MSASATNSLSVNAGKRYAPVSTSVSSGPCRTPTISGSVALQFLQNKGIVVEVTEPRGGRQVYVALSSPNKLRMGFAQIKPSTVKLSAEDAVRLFVQTVYYGSVSYDAFLALTGSSPTRPTRERYRDSRQTYETLRGLLGATTTQDLLSQMHGETTQ